MGRMYTVNFNAVAATAQQDFFEIVAAADKPCRIVALALSQSTEVADAQEEGMNILIKSGQTVSGSGGSAPTPIPLDAITGAAAGFTAEANNTTKANTGTIITHEAFNWNIRAPWLMIYPPEMRLELKGQRRMTVELATTPIDTVTFSGTLWVEEIG